MQSVQDPMARKREPKVVYSWRIFRMHGPNMIFIGVVRAPDTQSAVKTAIQALKIIDPQQQKQLLAERRD